jgi:alpha-D-ribose 1-methylphosphonate 5-triphosphate synthase subunit PhnH
MTKITFEDPSHDLARTFRPILDAMARPGRILPFNPPLAPALGLSLEAAAIALALCDFQTPIWLVNELRTTSIEHYLRFHTGAPLTRNSGEAVFVFGDAMFNLPPLTQFPMGTHEYPDRSATIIIQTKELRNDQGVRLKGPGIKSEDHLSVIGLSPEFWQQLIASRLNFPLGIDVIFVAPGAIAAIPRSTQIHLMEAV